MVGALDIKKLVVLSERAQKIEQFKMKRNEKKDRNESSSKRSMSRNFLTLAPKKSRDFRSQSAPSTGNMRKSIFRQTPLKTQATSIATASSVQNTDTSTCEHCAKTHFGVCRFKTRACFRCGSLEHFLRDCPNKVESGLEQVTRLVTVSQRGR
ncbi:Gag-Pol polyprotein [Gossypium australe]|uniref:Gag-Pol polyprotein n=1 Tax=Gossypium australe TaxID=47621 RepID=A0A5B6VNZ4_9ROSI|nr:Gag-Pol polyprotein [Gossypium australe]